MTDNKQLNSYELSRVWFNWCFENPENISPAHTAIYFFAIEHCNRLGWKTKFGFPTQMTMEATGIKKHQTYMKYFNDLCEWGFFELVQKSSNQYSANIIRIKTAMPKSGKALDKALVKHGAKQGQSTGQSEGVGYGSIIKQLNNRTSKQLNKGTTDAPPELVFPFSSEKFLTTWRALTKTKKWRKKEFTALQMALKKLSEHSEADAITMMENAITGEWQGLFELKPHEKNATNQFTQQTGKQSNVILTGDQHVELDRIANPDKYQ